MRWTQNRFFLPLGWPPSSYSFLLPSCLPLSQCTLKPASLPTPLGPSDLQNSTLHLLPRVSPTQDNCVEQIFTEVLGVAKDIWGTEQKTTSNYKSATKPWKYIFLSLPQRMPSGFLAPPCEEAHRGSQPTELLSFCPVWGSWAPDNFLPRLQLDIQNSALFYHTSVFRCLLISSLPIRSMPRGGRKWQEGACLLQMKGLLRRFPFYPRDKFCF